MIFKSQNTNIRSATYSVEKKRRKDAAGLISSYAMLVNITEGQILKK